VPNIGQSTLTVRSSRVLFVTVYDPTTDDVRLVHGYDGDDEARTALRAAQARFPGMVTTLLEAPSLAGLLLLRDRIVSARCPRWALTVGWIPPRPDSRAGDRRVPGNCSAHCWSPPTSVRRPTTARCLRRSCGSGCPAHPVQSWGGDPRIRRYAGGHSRRVRMWVASSATGPETDTVTDLDPVLGRPSGTVRESFLSGERSHCDVDAEDDGYFVSALDDFASYAAQASQVQVLWGVPYTTFWYVRGRQYLGTLILRHRLTPELTDVGGHIGYHVVPQYRRQGHATRMLGAGLDHARALGLNRVLLTCRTDNEPSRRTITANGGMFDGTRHGSDRFWIELP
jgi:predicted acetyltransferase